MPLYHNVPSRDPNPTGKFQHRRRIGTDRARPHAQGQWTWQLVTHRTGSTVRRTLYHVAIEDPAGVRTAYLQGYPSAEKAEQAAREWIRSHGGE